MSWGPSQRVVRHPSRGLLGAGLLGWDRGRVCTSCLAPCRIGGVGVWAGRPCVGRIHCWHVALSGTAAFGARWGLSSGAWLHAGLTTRVFGASHWVLRAQAVRLYRGEAQLGAFGASGSSCACWLAVLSTSARSIQTRRSDSVLRVWRCVYWPSRGRLGASAFLSAWSRGGVLVLGLRQSSALLDSGIRHPALVGQAAGGRVAVWSYGAVGAQCVWCYRGEAALGTFGPSCSLGALGIGLIVRYRHSALGPFAYWPSSASLFVLLWASAE